MREELLRIAERWEKHAAHFEKTYVGPHESADTFRACAEELRALAEKGGAMPVADREAARARFPDPAFQRWLDEGISDAGHTVFCTLGDVADAWAGWSAKDYYAQPVALPDQTLCRFYGVDSWEALVAAQEEHVLKLQDVARRNVKPWEDTFPPTLLPKYLRESGLDAPRALPVGLPVAEFAEAFDQLNSRTERTNRSDLITQCAQSVALPDGWVAVPREMTEPMRDAMHERIRILCDPAKKTADIQNDREVWAAIIAAAPAGEGVQRG